ncbi:TauD/TfdA family dioxygenase [Jidongwangia harbinensis]|uniref:TauD/TfdA family dioxygenase n=1 Tax=Jidongwangia harbinensis TaxID=2878561 RepID=UPI001CD928FF|nr:TauD/TfdA family dioxygenase [Jidongwangia harbinensis]MCA2218371.1 TauD/TfdA family dioxygenase [Jidongwangia harbinensis]
MTATAWTLGAPLLRPGRPPVLHLSEAAAAAGPARYRAHLRDLVHRHGAVLVRGLHLRDAAGFAAVARALTDRPVTEREGFAPRTRLGEGVYTSAQWPANEQMCMHHELSHRREVPGLLLFGCLTAPAQGGQTAVADSGAVLRSLPPDVVADAERLGWRVTRNLPAGGGVDRADYFGTTDPAAIAAYCRANDIACEHTADGGLRTTQRRPAVVTHPESGERLWFNEIAFLSEWTLDPDVREYLRSVYGPDGLPFRTHYGDGSEVPAATVAAIDAAYREHTVAEPWQDGDLLLVDNVRMAHSRPAFHGPREVLVAMADPVVPRPAKEEQW